MKRFKTLLEKFASLGVGGLICCEISKIHLSLLRKRFKFDEWHAAAPFCCRPYKQRVVDVIRSLDAKGVVELGCGIGDIGRRLHRLTGAHYCGIDLDAEAIRAARHLAGNKIALSFEVGSFEQLKDLTPGKFDTMLLLNWPHNTDTRTLADMIMHNMSRDTRFVLIDGIKQSVKSGYKYRHTPEGMINNGFSLDLKMVVKNIDDVRDLMVFER